ncbi:MAG: hypothetical protein QOJ54_3125 [Aliidongia sp.]|nr:hypothetical protein [Aliidongia sp.]
MTCRLSLRLRHRGRCQALYESVGIKGQAGHSAASSDMGLGTNCSGLMLTGAAVPPDTG